MLIIPALRKLRSDYIKNIRSAWAIKYDHASKKKKSNDNKWWSNINI